MVKVKICGITNWHDARTAVDFGADAIGFVFAGSPRRVTPKKAKQIIEKIGPFVTTVGVFVNERADKVNEIAAFCGLGAVQLHGDETQAYTKKLRCCKVIKAFRVGEGFSLKTALKFPADAYLFDTKVDGKYGGSGQSFDWNILNIEISKLTRDTEGEFSVILSGGLHPDNVAEAVRVISPYGVDVSSGVERLPGSKDPKLLREFIRNAKNA
ncbi:MAG TPA: phosphoribosylanthranilate isomerase [Candidatus Paceibacterota bacterium]|nr:MAG: hypothetical protein A3C47_04190 [Omnitrophica bacterium RIFCSPHIGHO2_02_FULL_51_18]